MCGIAGVINLKERIDPQKIKAMLTVIQHRGPDDEGYYFAGQSACKLAYGPQTVESLKAELEPVEAVENGLYHVALGHRRLSIIDVSSKGHQPMRSEEIVVSFNGEIYNFIEIREELRALGYHFNTDGDTEVILKSYQHWGEDCVKHFNGMWSFAIYDSKVHKLFCSRDRLGEKPLYYYMREGEFVFASEIKQILEYGVKAEVNESILFAFLHYGFNDHSEETFFKQIKSLKGGHNLSIQLDPEAGSYYLKDYAYWDLDMAQRASTTFENEAGAIGQALDQSIELRLRSDVKIGSCLSGGLDSSSIVAIVGDKLKQTGYDVSNFMTFTSCYDNHQAVDERVYSDQVTAHVGCQNTKIKPNTETLAKEFEQVVWHQDEPFRSMSIFAGWCVMKEAHQQGVKVLLDGQGGDEALLGYERFYAYHLKDQLKNKGLRRFLTDFKQASENSKLTLNMLLGYFIYFNNLSVRKMRLKKKNKPFLNEAFFNQYADLNIVDDMLHFNGTQDIQKNELTRAIGPLLRYEDRNSMAFSIEARVPFLDPDFVELAVGAPNEYKFWDGWTKSLLRKYMADKMPNEVTYRKNKLGFSVPQSSWIDDLNEHYKTLLTNTRSSKYFNMAYMNRIFNEKTNEEARFRFIVVETWMRVFNIEA